MNAISLDCVFAHDEISLACDMLMHYHALHIVFLLFSCALCSAVFSVFLLSLTLSLSFSLLLMAPKKSNPSKNSIRRGSSSFSSAPFPFDFVRFSDEKA